MTDQSNERRYLVGCAGQFAIGQGVSSYRDEDEAIVACLDGPVGCEVYDRVRDKWIGPTCMEEIEEAQARLAARKVAAT